MRYHRELGKKLLTSQAISTKGIAMNEEKQNEDPHDEETKPGKTLSDEELKEAAGSGDDPLLRKRPGRPSKESGILTEEELKRAAGGAIDHTSTRSNKGKCKDN